MRRSHHSVVRCLGLIALALNILIPLLPIGAISWAAPAWQPTPRAATPAPTPPPALAMPSMQLWLPSLFAGPALPATITPQGGVLSWDGGRVTLSAPAGAVAEPVEVAMRWEADPPATPAGRAAGLFLDLTAQTADGRPVSRFARPLTLRVQMDPPAGRALVDYRLAFFDEEAGRWVDLPTGAGAGAVEAPTDHFTDFAVLLAADETMESPTPTPSASPTPGTTPTPVPGCSIAIEPSLKGGYDAAEAAGIEPGCPKAAAYQLEGNTAQDFADGSTVVAGFYVGAGYIGGYRPAAAKIGKPLEHSFQAGTAPPYYQDDVRSFHGQKIQLFEKGFVGQTKTGAWIGAYHFPLLCEAKATIESIVIPPPQPPSDPPAEGIREVTYTVELWTQVTPFAPGGSDSLSSITIAPKRDGVALTPAALTLDGDRYRYSTTFAQPESAPIPALSFSAVAVRAGDGFKAYAPAIDKAEKEHKGAGTWPCPDGSTGGPGSGPPRDSQPPVIAKPTIFQDGFGGVTVETTITDNVAVADATLLIDDKPTPMQHLGGDRYGATVTGLAVGAHTLVITARDPSQNQGRWPESGSLVFRVEYSGVYGRVEWVGYSPDPINTLIGNFIYHYVDAALLGAGPTFELRRFYNSQSSLVGLFGLGWTTLFDARLTIVDNLLLSGAQLRYPDGRTANFRADGDGFARAPYGFDQLDRDDDGYLLTRTDGTRYRFDAEGRLDRLEDRSGVAIALRYEGDRLAEISAPGGRSLRLTSDGQGRVTRVEGPGGLSLGYSYDKDGRLLSVTDARGETVGYTYDAVGGLSRLSTPAGHDFIAEQRYDERGRVVFQRVGENFINAFAYDDANRTTVLSDTYGNTITYRYDEKNRLVERVDALGGVEQISYNDDNQRASYTDRAGATTTYAYDDDGNRIKETDALGGVRAWTYDDAHNPLTETDALGRVTRHTYDDQGRRTLTIDPAGGRAAWAYDDQGRLIAETDPAGATTTYTYDEAGNRASETDALGNTTTYRYDEAGRLIGKTDPLGGEWAWEYDAAGNQTAETDPLGHTTRYAYDQINRLIEQIDPLGRVTRHAYDRFDRLIRTTHPDGSETTFSYDDMGNRVGETDAGGSTTGSVLDALYRVAKETDALGNQTSYVYDAEGRTIAQSDANGATTRWEYDALGRVVKETDALGGVTRRVYDAAGNLLALTRPSGATTRWEYDALDREIARVDALGNTTRYEYDAAGRRTAEIDPLGAATRHEYDALGREVETIDTLGNVTRHAYDALGREVETIDALGNVTRHAYDALGREVETVDALGNVTRHKYDAAGQRVETVDALGNVTRHAYDALGREVETIDALGGVMRSTYDASGRRVAVTDANGNTARTVYDANGRPVEESDALGFGVRLAYDRVGNLIARTDQEGHTSTYAYDALGRKLRETDALGHTTSYVYDADGNLVSATDALGHTLRYEYDALGRKVVEADQLGRTTRYVYDAAGRQVGVRYAERVTVAVAYDALGRPIAETDGAGAVRQTTYDAVGNPVRVVDPRGNAVVTSFDALRRPTEVRDGVGLVERRAYDAVGSLVALTDGEGGTTSYRYDALRRPIAVTDAEGHTTRREYDAVGNLLAEVDGAGGVTRWAYDARNQRVAATDPNGHTTRYRHDRVGRPVAEIDPLGVITASAYDAVGRLTAVTLNYNASSLPNAATNVTTRYAYDAVGSRVAIVNPNGATVRFASDAARQLIAEIDPLGNTTTYAYDLAGRQVERREPDGNVVRSSYDRVGRLTATRYADGRVEGRAYDANGNLVELRDPSGVTRRSYDARNRPVAEETARGRVAFSYDLADRLVALTFPDGRVQRSSYLANGWQAAERLPDGRETRYAYDGAGRPIEERGGNNTLTARSFDPAGNLLAVETRRGGAEGRLSVAARYRYDARGQRVEVAYDYRDGSPRSVSESYTYDRLRRVVGMRDSAGVAVRYTYDAAGNRTGWRASDDPRTSKPFDALDLRYTYDAADQLLRAEDAAGATVLGFAYDTMGRRIERRAGRELTVYGYDGAGRLIAAQEYQLNGGGKRVAHELTSMAYDGLGRRVSKTVDAQAGGGGAKTRAYIYAGLDPIGYSEGWRGHHVNLYRDAAGGIAAQERYTGGDNPQRLWLTRDGLGSTLGTARDDGQAAKSYRHDPYGLADTREFDSDTHISYLYTGQEYDESTGLHHFYARDYDPETGTWLTRDPYRGAPDDPQSLHRYAYVKGDPVNLIDLYGYRASKQQLPRNQLLEKLLGALAKVNFEQTLGEAEHVLGAEGISEKDLKELIQKLRTRKLFQRSLLPSAVKDLPLVKDQFDPYVDIDGEFELDGDVERISGGLKLSLCAELEGKVEAGVTLKTHIRTFAVDVYGYAGLELEACYDMAVSLVQTTVGGKVAYYAGLSGDLHLYGALGIRAYGVLDIGVTGARAGLRFEAQLHGRWDFSTYADSGGEAKLRLEGAPFVGYKPFRWWKGGDEWEDKDLVTFYYERPLDFPN